MDSIWKSPHLGIALMVISPIMGLAFGALAFFPVLLTSILCGVVCLTANLASRHSAVGTLRADVIRDLISADQDRRDLVLAEINEDERNRILGAIRLGKAELRRRRRQSHSGSGNIRCARRFQYS